MRKWILIIGFFNFIWTSAFSDSYYQCCNIKSLPEFIITTEYSNRYSLIVNPKYVNIINPYDALGLEIAFGASEFRLGATWAHLINSCQRFKATIEYLSQDPTFHFVSGDTTQWTEQSSQAVLYQYLLNRQLFNYLTISAYHSHSRDENLPTIVFSTPQGVFSDTRSISGANTNGFSTGLGINPWHASILELQLAYDNIRYHSKEGPNHSGVGEIFRFEQCFNRYLKMQVSVTHRILFDEFDAGIKWRIYANNNHCVDLSLFGKYIDGDRIPELRETRLGIAISYRWDTNSNCSISFNTPCDQMTQALHFWSSQPAVRMPRAFVIQAEDVS